MVDSAAASPLIHTARPPLPVTRRCRRAYRTTAERTGPTTDTAHLLAAVLFDASRRVTHRDPSNLPPVLSFAEPDKPWHGLNSRDLIKRGKREDAPIRCLDHGAESVTRPSPAEA